MTNGKSMVTGLLALIAILLTLNLIMQYEPQAQAQTQTNLGPPPLPKVVGGSGEQLGPDLLIYRIWDNGWVDLSRFTQNANCVYTPLCSTELIGGCRDLNGDGFVGTEDLLLLFEDWGACEF